MKITSILFILFGIYSFTSGSASRQTSEQEYLSKINANWSPRGDSQEENKTLAAFRDNFENLEHNGMLGGCEKCKARLALGKILALNQPNLVPTVFIEWCLRKGHTETGCFSKFGTKSINHSDSTISDFSNILQLMSPFSADGDWFCYYHDAECSDKPNAPQDVNKLMATWYPPKPVDASPPESLGLDTFYVLQLSDIDYQIDYHIGAESNCSQEVCCIHCGFNDKKAPINWDIGGGVTKNKYQLSYYNSSYDENNDFVKGPFVDVTAATYKGTWLPAHEFGSYRCGTPELLVNNTLRAASNPAVTSTDTVLDIQYVLFNGGTQVRSNSFDETVKSEVKILQLLKHFFETIPVITSLGKFDTYPDSQLAQYSAARNEQFSWNEELYGDLLLENKWITNEQFRSIKTHNGAHSVVTEYGLKIISLNSNFYNADNYYTFWKIADIDSFGQIKFLIDELIDSEKNGQRVWLMSSLSLSSEKALPFQAKILENIIRRFTPHTIAEVFFGDKHQDSYNILFEDDEDCDSEPVAGAWIAPSVSPLHGNNPGFRYYEIDSRTFSVLNAYTYYSSLDVTYANGGEEPKWELLYSTRDSYTHEGGSEFWGSELPLNATFWNKVLKKRIKDNLSYKQLYQNNKFKLSPLTPVCSKERDYARCELSYCEIASFTFDEYEDCVATRFPALYAEAF